MKEHLVHSRHCSSHEQNSPCVQPSSLQPRVEHHGVESPCRPTCSVILPCLLVGVPGNKSNGADAQYDCRRGRPDGWRLLVGHPRSRWSPCALLVGCGRSPLASCFGCGWSPRAPRVGCERSLHATRPGSRWGLLALPPCCGRSLHAPRPGSRWSPRALCLGYGRSLHAPHPGSRWSPRALCLDCGWSLHAPRPGSRWGPLAPRECGERTAGTCRRHCAPQGKD
ncbi:hypothetical protein GUJ93_ZPchr0002g26275 [Zizania palustris]|uniref:Uncharacterized protein n=1 Tax=Zizania palustris TaxID=103762 RepID=A0A8J5VGY8_ZIZPA|nr:hypothetical protein GUJ93_ZPchr0002g26275 [Zizania palustris]